MKSVLLFSSMAMLIAAGDLPAQDPQAPPRKIRLVVVGDPPPFQQEYRNGVPYESEPPAGSIPPREVEVSAGADGSQSMKLTLGETTAPIQVPGAATQVNLSVGGRVWHALKLPEGGDYLAILMRDPQRKNWDEARSILIQEGMGKFDEGDVRFISLTAAPLRIQIMGSAAFEVPPGKAITQKLGVMAGTETLAQYRDPKEGWKKLWSSALVQNPGERTTLMVYLADGVNPRQPLKVVVLREKTAPAPILAPPPPR